MINAKRTAMAQAGRGIVHMNGTRIKWTTFEVVTQNYYQADTFRINIPINGQPDGFDTDYFLSQPAILCQIYAGVPPDQNNYNENDLESLIIGAVEPVNTNRVGGMIQLAGRDLTSKFIDNKIYDKFPNLTFSQVAERLAAKEGLKTSIVPTSVKVGTYYNTDFIQNLDTATTEWDLLTFLAQQSNYLIYVKDQTLIGIPQPSPNSNPYGLQCNFPDDGGVPTGNFLTIGVDRDLTRARDVIVEVRSYNLRSGKSTVIKIRATPNKNSVIKQIAQPIGDAQVFSYEETNLSPEQALAFAQQKMKEITQTERILKFTDAANSDLKKSSVIQLTGYSTSADQIYFPDTITRRMAIDGYFMEVSAKNHSPNSVKLLT